MDFSNAQLPRLLPLEASYAENGVEDDLKRLFLDVFDATLAPKVFDANVLGSAHLGSFDLVRRAVNADGLVLMQGDREEAATRYLYKAWKSGDVQGRGLHFLRTYLQMLFPDSFRINQLWHDKTSPYPSALYATESIFAWWLHQVGEPGLKLDGTWGIGRRIEGADESRAHRVIDTSRMFLTSRIEIALDFGVNVRSIAELMHIIRSVIPARLVPIFRFWLNATFNFPVAAAYSLWMEKDVTVRYPWCGRVVTDDSIGRWSLGIDGVPPRLPQPFGTFKLGHLIGAKSNWHLRSCRATGNVSASISGDALAWRMETLPTDAPPKYASAIYPTKLYQRVRRLDGSWPVGSGVHVGTFALDGSTRLGSRKMKEFPRFGTFKIRDYKPPVLLPPVPARLTVSGHWKLGGRRNPAFDFYVKE